MERRKVLLVVFLLIAIILQSVIPFSVVNASTGVEITLNKNLYKAVKSQLEQQKISATYLDSNNTIIIEQAQLNKVTNLDLSNSSIKDLTNLSTFSNLEVLNLTANELTKDSNLGEISSLSKLSRLNLSSNKLESVSAITNFDNIEYTDITNQEVKVREIIKVDTTETSDHEAKATVVLPDILLKDKNMIDADWIDFETEGYGTNAAPEVDWSSVKSGSTEVDLTIANGQGDDWQPRKGLVTVKINIKDSESKLANTKMNLYYAVIDSDETGIIFNDENLYNVIKAQLTKNQTINDDLLSHRDNGNKAKTLYNKAYDEALILVIDTNTLINKITSLILNDKKIIDLTGLEEFVGITSNLNISYNYIDTIEKIVKLEKNKEEKEKELQDRFSKQLEKTRDYYNEIFSIKAQIKDNEKTIEDLEEGVEKQQQKISEEISQKNQEIVELLGSSDYDTNEDKQKQVEQLEKDVESLTKQFNELPDTIEEQKQDIIRENNELNARRIRFETALANSLEKLYRIYEKEYKFTTLLPLEVKELPVYEEYNLDYDTTKAYAESIWSRVIALESAQALTKLETNAIIELFNIGTVDVNGEDIEYPIANYRNLENEIDETQPISYYQNIIHIFRILDIYTVANNYALINALYGENEANMQDAIEYVLENNFEEKDRDSYINDSVIKLEGDLIYVNNDTEIEYDKIDNFNQTDYKYVLGGKLSKATGEEIAAYIKLPRIENLNLNDNKISELTGLETLKELKELRVYKNLLGTIGNVNWSTFEKLKVLDLGYNQLSNIKPLEVLKGLTHLSVRKNLLSGSFDFYLADKKDLERADFSENQYSDIAYLVNQFKFIAKSYGITVEEFIRTKINVDFKYQTLKMSLTAEKTGDSIIVELPKIFEQLEKIDHDRTSFGIDSQRGTVLADGTGVLLMTPATGKYTAAVNVGCLNGYETSNSNLGDALQTMLAQGIGFGTSCTIDYTIVDKATVPDNNNGNNQQQDPTNPANPTDNTGNVEKPSYGYTVKDGYVYVLKPETTVTDFVGKIVDTTKYTAKVTNPKGVTNNIATGAVVSIETKDGKDVEILEVVVKGDVNGDGEIDALDSGILRNVISDVTALVGVYKSAADVNSDGDIDSLDSLQVLKYRADKISSFEQ